MPSAFAPHIGGVEELTRQLALAQSRQRMTPLVLTNRYPKSLSPSSQVDGVDVRREVLRVPGGGARQRAGAALLGGRTRRRTRHLISAHEADLVHVQCVSSNGWYALDAAEALSLPLVVSLQGEISMDADQIYQRAPELRSMWKQLLARADAVTGCSQYVLDEAEDLYGQPFGARATVIPNGIRPADFSLRRPPPWSEQYVFSLGRLVRQKGFDLLIEALALSKQTCSLLIGGQGPEQQRLQDQAVDLGLADRVHFVGPLDRSAVAAHLQHAALFVLPSRHEPQGIVVLEAMAAGTPVVAASAGGVPETVQHGQNGLLFAPGDPRALATAIDEVLSAPERSQARVASGSRTVRSRDWQVLERDYAGVYEAARTRRASVVP